MLRSQTTVVALAPETAGPCGEGCRRRAEIDLDGCVYCAGCLARLVRLGNVFSDAADEAAADLPPRPADPTEPCGRTMVGQGTDVYDPVCVLIDGHDGPCKSDWDEPA